jgi:hypothetical protein
MYSYYFNWHLEVKIRSQLVDDMIQNILEHIAITVAPRPSITGQKCGDSHSLKSALCTQKQSAVTKKYPFSYLYIFVKFNINSISAIPVTGCEGP